MNKVYNLYDLGWNEELSKQYEGLLNSYTIGRVAVEYKGMYKIYCEKGELFASVSGKMMHSAEGRNDYPAVGDWIVLDNIHDNDDRAVIKDILKRKSKFARKCAGNTYEEQIVAVNVDTLFICMSLNQNYNIRRMERYLTMAWDSGAIPVVLLTKMDLCSDIEQKLAEVQAAAPGVDILCISSLTGEGLDRFRSYVKPGITVAFLGSSGVGKSTLINTLAGEILLETQEVSSLGDRGRHTTTNRELIPLSNGSIVIDTPGMRELQLLDADEGLDTAFEDIDALASGCKFSDCSHEREPGCAVREAIESGLLSQSRFLSYLKLKKEAEFIKRKMDKKAQQNYKSFVKKLSKQFR